MGSAEARRYREDFDSIYPEYLALYHSEAWQRVICLRDELAFLVMSSEETDSSKQSRAIQVVAELEECLSQVRGHATDSGQRRDELRLAVYDFKLRLIKSRLQEWFSNQRPHADKLLQPISTASISTLQTANPGPIKTSTNFSKSRKPDILSTRVEKRRRTTQIAPTVVDKPSSNSKELVHSPSHTSASILPALSRQYSMVK
ncbi:unnamed protein product [Protopolystoma xenopodis]|uniref:OCEL domain-containing protein n=1 Tax=Protopolystoma xenopodis TaxID=117903 RepID=A0A3S5AWB9_9PLAT|nr:unnamed protein product [Protopolystoma xenopodis]